MPKTEGEGEGEMKMAEHVNLVSQLEMPEYIRLTRDDSLVRKWLPEKERYETYPEAFRRMKDEEKVKGTLFGWIDSGRD